MIKISKLADYAVIILTSYVDEQGQLFSSSQLAQRTKLPEPTVSKVLKLLSQANLLHSIRGANGGYKLSAELKNITVLDVINAIDGTLAITACVEHANANSEQCSHAGSCALKGRWNIVNTHVANALEKVSLQDMVCPVNEPRTVNG
ncbi:MAG: SUF system Fe-S cluster assembly regulator [Micavibrio sp.]|nr:SUF system Fe-S cluster assembly regulator [Micavibrio sp.]|tara:strand:+ start:536 stop:976 length:441 start_codon:yes stop_codon:yes gene_type:complete